MSENTHRFSAPVPINTNHDLADFHSSEESLDHWLRERSIDNMQTGASRTYVICPSGSHQVIGYYAVCMGQILNQEAIGSMRRNMPRQIPAVVLGRLAIDRNWQGKGLGGALLRDAVERAARASKEISARLIIVHAISPDAESFYQHHGFVRLPSFDGSTYALDLGKYTLPLLPKEQNDGVTPT
jgi:GNAT superfamily N-acetyltransferase